MPALPLVENSRYIGGAGTPYYWRWLTFLFAVLWLITLLVLWSRRIGKENLDSKAHFVPDEDESRLLKSLERSCSQANTGQTRQALGHWLERYGPVSASGSLLDFAEYLEDQPLRASVYAMDSEGFRPDSNGNWNSKQFWKQFETWRKNWQASPNIEKPPVTDLYAKENRDV